jgi:hypothetical protein
VDAPVKPTASKPIVIVLEAAIDFIGNRDEPDNVAVELAHATRHQRALFASYFLIFVSLRFCNYGRAQHKLRVNYKYRLWKLKWSPIMESAALAMVLGPPKS